MDDDYLEADDIDRITAEGYALKTKIELLRAQNDKIRNGFGSACVNSILSYLDIQDFEGAKRVFETDGDKVRQYPEIEETLISIFGCRMHGADNCSNKFCKR